MPEKKREEISKNNVGENKQNGIRTHTAFLNDTSRGRGPESAWLLADPPPIPLRFPRPEEKALGEIPAGLRAVISGSSRCRPGIRQMLGDLGMSISRKGWWRVRIRLLFKTRGGPCPRGGHRRQKEAWGGVGGYCVPTSWVFEGLFGIKKSCIRVRYCVFVRKRFGIEIVGV